MGISVAASSAVKELQALLDDRAEGGTKKFTEEDFKTLMAPLSVEST